MKRRGFRSSDRAALEHIHTEVINKIEIATETVTIEIDQEMIVIASASMRVLIVKPLPDSYSCPLQQIVQRVLGKHAAFQVRRKLASLIGFIVIPPLAGSVVSIQEAELFRVGTG